MTSSPKDLSKNPTNKINLLPEHIIDQIKAGEVIERPATLLKELLENSVDAESSKISVHIINFGLDLISVEDNGIGIDFEDLPLAFCRHATSKIDSFDDLYKLYTYGFRGEALASMASVSKMTCTSNKANSSKGTIKVSGAQVVSHNKQDTPQKSSGTSIYVKDLFFNTPVRMKFLQSQTSERNQLKRILNAFILTHPEIEFSIKWDDGARDTFPIVTRLEERIKKLFEKKKDPLDIISFKTEYDGSELEMFISLNSSKGYAGKFQYIFINGRYVQDVQIHKIILNSAQSLWPVGETGNYIAFLTISPDQLDVNVHPNKTVIKLFAASSVFSLLSSSIKKFLPKTDRSTLNLPSQANLSIERDIKNFGEVNYKSQNFNEENSLQNYFNDLDKGSESNSIMQNDTIHIHFKDLYATFFSRGHDFFICDNKELFKFYIESLLFADKEKKSTPLLVSAPITVDKKIKSKKLKDLETIGFELDFFDDKTIVLRAFPQVLSSFPFEEILRVLLDDKTVFESGRWSLASLSKQRSKQSSDIHYKPTRGNLESMIELLGVAKLIERKLLKQISGKDFLGLI